MTESHSPVRLTWYDLEQLTGISVRSLRAILYRADKHRRIAEETGDYSVIKPGDLPKPDGYEAREGKPGRPRPYWHPETVRPWIGHKLKRSQL